METAELLKKAGLNSSEARMYLRLLEPNTEIPLGELIKELQMTEFTGYRTARLLDARGLISITKNKNLRYAKARPLTRVAKIVANQSRKLRRLELSILNAAQKLGGEDGSSHTKDSVIVREGVELFSETYEEIAECGLDELYCMGSMGNLWRVIGHDYFSPFEQDFIRRRVKRGTKAFVLDLEHSTFHILMEKAHRELRSVRLVKAWQDPKEYTIIVGDKIYLFDMNFYKPKTTIITNKSLAHYVKGYHKSLWENAPKFEW